MRSFTIREYRARLGRRHFLAAEQPGDPVPAITAAMVGLHATDPATPYLSLWARFPGFTVEDLDRELYERRRLFADALKAGVATDGDAHGLIARVRPSLGIWPRPGQRHRDAHRSAGADRKIRSRSREALGWRNTFRGAAAHAWARPPTVSKPATIPTRPPPASTPGRCSASTRCPRDRTAGPYHHQLAHRIPRLLHHRSNEQWTHQSRQPAHQENHASRTRISKFRQLLAASPTALRNHLATSHPDTTKRSVTTLGCVEPDISLTPADADATDQT